MILNIYLFMNEENLKKVKIKLLNKLNYYFYFFYLVKIMNYLLLTVL